jgi:hypothetical protein
VFVIQVSVCTELEGEEERCVKDTDPNAASLTLSFDEAFHHVMTGCYPCDFERVRIHNTFSCGLLRQCTCVDGFRR